MGRRERYIRDLAAKMGVNVYLERGDYLHGECYYGDLGRYEGPWIIVRGWDGRNTLCTLAALHELGHHACGTASRALGYERGIVEAEAEAWNWALDHWPERTLCRSFFRTMKNQWISSYIRCDDPDLVTAGTEYRRLTRTVKGLPNKEAVV